MKITSRYVLREHLGPLLFALSALTSLLLLNFIARRFGDLVGKGLPWQAIAEFFLLSVPFTIAMTLPMAVLVSTLYAFSRLASENEITAFKASGVSMRRLLSPALWSSLVLAVGMLAFNDQVLPRANHRLSVLQQDIARTKPTFALRPQVINEIKPGQFMLRASQVDPSRNTMREVTIYDMSAPSPRTIRADSGALALAVNQRDLQLTLWHGSIAELAQGKPEQLQRIYYQTNLVRVKDVTGSFSSTKPGQDQFKSNREMSICELQDAYLRARKDYLLADLELQRAIADSLKRPAPKSSPKRRVFLGVGRVYCDALNQALALVRVKTAAAAEVHPRGTAAQPPVQDTARAPRPATPAGQQPPTTQPPTTQPASPQPPATQPAPTPGAPATTTPAAPATPGAAPAQPAPGQPAPGQPVPGQPVPATTVPPTPAPGTPGAVVPPPAVPGTTAFPPGGVPVPPGTAVSPGTPGPGGGPAPVPPNVQSAAPMPPPSTGLVPSTVGIARLRVEDTRSMMNDYDVEIHKKFALAGACIVFVLLGAPIALRFPRGGVGLVIGVSLFVFAVYYSFLLAGEELATRGFMPAWLGMWGANILLAIVGLALAARMGNESGSARGGGFGELLHALKSRLRRQGA